MFVEGGTGREDASSSAAGVEMEAGRWRLGWASVKCRMDVG